MEEPVWTVPYWNDEIARFKRDELFAVDALLLGRVTYQGFEAAWPGRTDAEGYADRMNTLPKHVVSTSLDNVSWNNSNLIKTNVTDEIARLKQQPGQDILVFGSGLLSQYLMQHFLVDEYHLLVYPLVLGKGKRLFQDGGASTDLKLSENRMFGSGVVLLVYQPAKK
jgi:dihydrofolate reductase